MKNIIFENQNYRIVELYDEYADMEDLKGESFDPKVNPDIDPKVLKEQEVAFEQEVFEKGVFGYVLEKKCQACGNWEHKDSCWGFIGIHANENHYIVEEFMETIRKND